MVTVWSGSVIAAINENYYFRLMNNYEYYRSIVFNTDEMNGCSMYFPNTGADRIHLKSCMQYAIEAMSLNKKIQPLLIQAYNDIYYRNIKYAIANHYYAIKNEQARLQTTYSIMKGRIDSSQSGSDYLAENRKNARDNFAKP